jgi:hypothetical protein
MNTSPTYRRSRRKEALIPLALGPRPSAIIIGLLTLVAAIALPLQAAPKNQPRLVSVSTNGILVYDADAQSNRVPDFSGCGYAGGDIQIPDAPIQVVVAPAKGDNTARIQQAIDYIAGRPTDSNGVRGAVLLLKGRHEVTGGLHIANSGIVLRGQGMGEDGTTLVAAGFDRRTLIRIVGRSDRTSSTGKSWEIKDDYVPVGATAVHLADAAGLKVGDTIFIMRPSTQEWIDRLGANEFGGGVGGGWKPGSRDLVWDRIVKSIEGSLVTVDAPITTALEKEFGGGRVEAYEWPGRITNVGIEKLQLESTCDAGNPKDENHSWCAVTMENAADCWVRQVTFKHFAGSAVAIYETCKRITVQDCLSLEPVSEIGGYRRHTFFTMGQQTLFLRCSAEHGRHDFSVGHCAAGPNAFVQCEAREALDDSGPIESWAAGVLYDSVTVDGNAITLGYRPGNNAAIGWAAANCVLWNCSASVIRCWNPPAGVAEANSNATNQAGANSDATAGGSNTPARRRPGAQNWSFGSWAGFEGDGIWRSSNDTLSPDSLFVAQLRNRLGDEAAKRVPLMPRPKDVSSNPTVEKAQESAAASHQPAPLLTDFITAAAKRDPIPAEPGNAKRIEEISSRSSRGNEAQTSNPQTSQSLLTSAATKLTITNGWLTVKGKLLIGGLEDVAWWRGNIRPDEAPTFGLGLTRFVPGRVGPGFTDDLNELADTLVAKGQVALDHHYGLWYERRRDDHERVRRMTGDVLPPFYELPFARSGQGTAWDGLSKYDLTQFNPWYWSRLREFADICDERGLVLFHENYFQHNIIEAGAHWADFPWRSANNINQTGFPEPPPYAGDKRIFQAELFYDVKHPVRRELHRGYIRQCLDNFTNNANVIQFASAEFTGPLHFVQFWLDTVAEWQKERSRRGAEAEFPASQSVRLLTSAATKPLIALATTKDVQDAILADAKRAALVDVICFRYWWRTDKGEFAPPGGKNLAPRQFQRQWKGGAPNDVNLATMAAEYRQRFPAKAVIAASEQGADLSRSGWAFVCAGGSLPNLPQTADARLLAAIPRMQPWAGASTTNRWVLREPGKQLLLYLSPSASPELDLTQEQGTFVVQSVSLGSGKVNALPDRLAAGQKADLGKFVNSGASVLWLVRE